MEGPLHSAAGSPPESAGSPCESAALPRELHLDLLVRDVEVVAELCRHAKGPPRQEFALAALRLGVLALRQASGVIDSAAIRAEGQHLVGQVRETLATQAAELVGRLQGLVLQYFDPQTGQLPQRLERLLRKDGELEAVLARHVAGDDSTIAQTLARHIGAQSPIFRLLSPTQTDGLLAALSQCLTQALQVQREQILAQFSLDCEGSALARLVGELTDANGVLKTELARDIEKVVREFSLDNADGALARLVRRVEQAQATISGEFSLDNRDSALSRLSELLRATNTAVTASLTLDDEKSPLARLRAELLKVVTELGDANTRFQQEVRETLAVLNARRQEAARSTRHGGEFEAAVGDLLQAEAQRLGDVYAAVGDMVGTRPRCKVGDHTLTLGAESAAPGAIIVCEAKEREGYALASALEELREARQNRRAQAGLFVFSRRTAPAGLEPVQRYGPDVVVVWDRDDPLSDPYLKAGLSIARALVVRERNASRAEQAELVELERAIARIARDAERIEQIGTYAQTAQSAVGKIAKETEAIRESLDAQVERLRAYATAQRHGDQFAAA